MAGAELESKHSKGTSGSTRETSNISSKVSRYKCMIYIY